MDAGRTGRTGRRPVREAPARGVMDAPAGDAPLNRTQPRLSITMIKRSAFFLPLLLLVAVAAACGADGGPGASATADSADMVTGTTGAPGPGTAGTPGTPGATNPDTIGEGAADTVGLR